MIKYTNISFMKWAVLIYLYQLIVNRSIELQGSFLLEWYFSTSWTWSTEYLFFLFFFLFGFSIFLSILEATWNKERKLNYLNDSLKTNLLTRFNTCQSFATNIIFLFALFNRVRRIKKRKILSIKHLQVLRIVSIVIQ